MGVYTKAYVEGVRQAERELEEDLKAGTVRAGEYDEFLANEIDSAHHKGLYAVAAAAVGDWLGICADRNREKMIRFRNVTESYFECNAGIPAEAWKLGVVAVMVKRAEKRAA